MSSKNSHVREVYVEERHLRPLLKRPAEMAQRVVAACIRKARAAETWRPFGRFFVRPWSSG